MDAGHQVTAILFFATVVGVALCCEVDNVAVYKVKLHTLWSAVTFPKDYPEHGLKAQWSQVFGQSHNSSYSLYHIGEVAPPSTRQFTQDGDIVPLLSNGDEDSRVYDQFTLPAVGSGVGSSEAVVLVKGDHSLVSLICRMTPSPDWFVGVDSLDLCVNSDWVDQVTLDLDPLDGGVSSGPSFTSPRWATIPVMPVTRHSPRDPALPAASFYYPMLRDLPSIAKIEFTKIKEYSSKELNDLVKEELFSSLQGFPRNQRKSELNMHTAHYPDSDEFQDSEEKHKDFYTESPLQKLMDLEEDSVGTPEPNVPDNNVVVVTKSPPKLFENEAAGSKLDNMDEVVLAVAHGRKLGLGRHLPRHFRHRLHHAVNKIQPAEDCLVSDWSPWSACSVTCGEGESIREREILRQRGGNGRECPDLVDRRRCVNDHPCDAANYLDD